jgi:hypothetical protein
VPGRSGQSRKANEAFETSHVGSTLNESMETGGGGGPPDWSQAAANIARLPAAQSLQELQLRQMMLHNMGAVSGMGGLGATAVASAETSFFDSQQAAIQQQLNFIQQLQAQQNAIERSRLGGGDIQNTMIGGGEPREPPAQKMKLEQPKPTESANTDAHGVPKTIASHTHLLELSDPDGSRLRAYYRLSVDELFGFPPTPTEEEYCMRLNVPGMTPRMIPGTHLAALSAARFAEVALGAIVHNEVSLGMELCNAVVHCLKESVQEPVQPPYMFEVARSYFLLGVFRAFRGDMLRYFKYRRVCLTYVSKLEVRKSFCLYIVAAYATCSFLEFHSIVERRQCCDFISCYGLLGRLDVHDL